MAIFSICNQRQWIWGLILFITGLSLLTGCNNTSESLGVIATAIPVAAGIFLTSSPATVPLVVFAGGRLQKPAALLPFTSELQALAVAPKEGRYLYAADRLHNTVSVIDTTTRRTIAVLDVGTGPTFVAVTPDDGTVVVANFGTEDHPDDSISIIDAATLQVTTVRQSGRRTIGQRPLAIAVSPDSKTAYVASVNDRKIAVVDLANAAITQEIALNDVPDAVSEPIGLGLTLDGETLLVLTGVSPFQRLRKSGELPTLTRGSLQVIETQTHQLVHVQSLGSQPSALALHPEDTLAYVTDFLDHTVSVFDLSQRTITETIDLEIAPDPGGSPSLVGPGLVGAVVDADGQRLYAAIASEGDNPCLESQPGRVAVIDAQDNTVIDHGVAVGKTPVGLVITPRGDKLYAISACEETVSRVAADSLAVQSIAVTDRATAVAISPTQREVYVAHPHAVAVINTRNDRLVTAGIPARGDGPTRLALAEDGNSLFALHAGSDTLSVVDLAGPHAALQDQINTGSRPADLAVRQGDAGQPWVWVANAGYSRKPDNRITAFKAAATPGGTETIDTIFTTTEPLDPLNDGDIPGRGPVRIQTVSIPRVPPPIDGSALEKQVAFTVNFGGFFLNNRQRGNSVFLFDAEDEQASQRLIDFLASPLNLSFGFFPVDAVLDPAASAEATDQDFVLHVFSPNLNDAFLSGGIVSIRVALADFSPLAGVQLTDEDLGVPPGDTTLAQPMGGFLFNQHLYVAGYWPVSGQTRVNIFARDANRTDLSLVDTITFPGESPAKMILHEQRQIAFVVHAGDRSLICEAPDGFCDIGRTVTAIKLVPDGGGGGTPPLTFAQQTLSIPVGRRPADIAFSGDGSKALVSNFADNSVSVIDLDSLDFSGASAPGVSTVDVGQGPWGLAVAEDNGKAYVANTIDNTVTVLALGQYPDDTAIASTIALAP